MEGGAADGGAGVGAGEGVDADALLEGAVGPHGLHHHHASPLTSGLERHSGRGSMTLGPARRTRGRSAGRRRPARRRSWRVR